MSKTEQINRVHATAGRLVYDLDMPQNTRHPPRFLLLKDVCRAAGLPEPLPNDIDVTKPSIHITHSNHFSDCDCRFCVTDLLDTRTHKLLP